MAYIQKAQNDYSLTPRAFEAKGDRYPDYDRTKARGRGRKPRRAKGGASLRSLNAVLFLAEDED